MRYLTKDWYLKCQIYPQTAALKEELEKTENSCRAELVKQNLPADLRGKFMFHDGNVSQVKTGTDFTMEISSPYSEYHRIIFRNAVLKQDMPPVGATWLYEELYRHKSGVGYEAHILFFKMMKPRHKTILDSDLFETRIICEDIVFE